MSKEEEEEGRKPPIILADVLVKLKKPRRPLQELPPQELNYDDEVAILSQLAKAMIGSRNRKRFRNRRRFMNRRRFRNRRRFENGRRLRNRRQADERGNGSVDFTQNDLVNIKQI